MANNIVKFYSITKELYDNHVSQLDNNALYFVESNGTFEIYKGNKGLRGINFYTIETSNKNYEIDALTQSISSKSGDYAQVTVSYEESGVTKTYDHLWVKLSTRWFNISGAFGQISDIFDDVVILKEDIDELKGKVDALASATHFKGKRDEIPSANSGDYQSGDIIIVDNLEYILVEETPADGDTPATYRWEEFGDPSAEWEKINQLLKSEHKHDNLGVLNGISVERVRNWDIAFDSVTWRTNFDVLETSIEGITGSADGEILKNAFIAAGSAGDPVNITLSDNLETTTAIQANGGTVNFNLNGKFIVVDATTGSNGTQNQSFWFLKGSNVTIENGMLFAVADSASPKRVIQNYADLTLNNVIVDGRSCIEVSGTQETISNCYGNIHFTGNTLIMAKTPEKNAFDCYFWPSHKEAGVPVYADGCKILVDEGVEIVGNIGFDADDTGKADPDFLNKANIYIPASYALSKWADKLPSGYKWVECEDGDTWNGSAVPANHYKVGKVNLG